MNVRFTFRRWIPALAATVVVSISALYLLVNAGAARGRVAAVEASAAVTFEDARSVLDRRCTVCHSAQPSDLSFGPMPGGVAFDTPGQIRALADRIRARAVETQTMPPANKTRITGEERALLGAWTAAQR
jgi:uncharacterized membrane protein